MAAFVDASDLVVRHEVYRSLAETGRAPTVAALTDRYGLESASRLRRLADAHMLVLADDGEVRMALPFSAIPTEHLVISGDRSWFANCAWDALAIPLLLDIDAKIESVWLDDESPLIASFTRGEPTSPDGFVNFAHPAKRWWDDIVET